MVYDIYVWKALIIGVQYPLIYYTTDTHPVIAESVINEVTASLAQENP